MKKLILIFLLLLPIVNAIPVSYKGEVDFEDFRDYALQVKSEKGITVKFLEDKNFVLNYLENYGAKLEFYFGCFLFKKEEQEMPGSIVDLGRIEIDADKVNKKTFYKDSDGDGFGDSKEALEICFLREGYVSEKGDCDDSNKNVYPGADEVCDGYDNDCDGNVDGIMRDFSCGLGACKSEVLQRCSFGVWEPECFVKSSSDEMCNGLDDDCDGLVDEDLKKFRGTDVGECEFGWESCTSGGWSDINNGKEPAEEICDGKDNDCDGLIDEDLFESFGGGGECEKGIKECREGKWAITKEAGKSMEEVCDGLDNDCDGIIDNGFNDLDEDGIKDCVDRDIDGDNVLNKYDTIAGYVEDINTNLEELDVRIDEMSLSKTEKDKIHSHFPGKRRIKIKAEDSVVLEYNIYIEAGTNPLILHEMEILNLEEGLSLKGIKGENLKIYMDKMDKESNAVCVNEGSEECETVICDLELYGEYRCSVIDNKFKVEGVKEDAIIKEARGFYQADFDEDGCVGFSDFLLFAEKFEKEYAERMDYDLNGIVDFPDFVWFAKEYGKGKCPSAKIAVPRNKLGEYLNNSGK